MRVSRVFGYLQLLAIFPLVFSPVAGLADSLAEMRDRGMLVVGMDPPYGVMEFYDADRNLTGIDVDLSRAIAESLGVSVEFKTMPFAELFDALKSDKVDIVVSAVSITRERQQTMLFSAPYLDASLNAITREDNDSITGLDDLGNATIGVLEGTVGEKFARESPLFEDATVLSFKNNDERMRSLGDGGIDVALVHFQTPGAYPVKTLDQPLKQAYYGVVAKLENTGLMEHIDRLLREMKREGSLRKFRAKYIQ